MTQLKKKKEDFEACFKSKFTWRSFLRKYIAFPGVKAVALYRLSRSLHLSGHIVLPQLLVCYSISKTGAEILPTADIGGGFVIKHPVGIVVGATAVAGRMLTLLQGVTLGENYKQKDKDQYPTLGNNITVCANSAILGPVVIGDHVIVAANSIVLKSFSEMCIVGGIPAVKKGEADPQSFYWK
jgi:serine O-acetyltransferase